MSFLKKVVDSLNTFPDGNAFFIQDKFYTYTQLRTYIAATQELLEIHCAAEERIGIIASDDIATYTAILAILLSGRTYIPIGPTDPHDRVEQVIEQSGMQTIFSAEPINAITGIQNIVLSADVLEKGGEVTTADFELAGRNAYILFTSGSTGKPKGVPLTYGNLEAFVSAFFALDYRTGPGDRFLQMFDLTFDLSIMSYLIPLCVGACVYTASGKGSKYANVYTILVEHDITFALMVPSILSFLRPYFDEVELPAMRYSLFCGEALHTATTKEWLKCVPKAVVENVYGPTEATIFCTNYQVPREGEIEDSNGIISIGKPMQDVETIIFGDGNILPDGEKGELCLHGPQVTSGYLDEEKTALAFFEYEGKRYYRTGDIAYRNGNGNLIYCGRADHQVKVQGFRIELGEIEHHLKQISGRHAVAVAVTDDTTETTWLAAAIEGQPFETESLSEALRGKLPHYMVPSRTYFIPSFPLNVNGKTDRNAIKKLILAQ